MNMELLFYIFQRIEDHRRKWDRDEYEKLAKERLDQELEAQQEKGL